MDLNTTDFYTALRNTGNSQLMMWADGLERGEVALGAACKVIQGQTDTRALQVQNANGTTTTYVQIPGANQPSSTPYFPPQQPPAQLPNPGMGNCKNLKEWVQQQYTSQCGLCPNSCLADWIAFAIYMTSAAETRNDFSIPQLALQPTEVIPTGPPSNGMGTTTFVSTFPVQPGQSILLRVQNYSLPFNPRCLWGVLGWSGGDIEANYDHVLFKAWVGPKALPASFGLLDGTLTEWHDKQWIYGSQFRCGTRCQEVALRSYTGCADVDIVGVASTMYIQVDNLSTNSNNITGQQMVLRLGGFERPCCNECQAGRQCQSGCANHKH